MSLYLYPRFSKIDTGVFRIGGAGLGNLLSIYCRALVVSKKYQVPLIWPTWNTVKIGTFLRKERDKRLYKELFVPNANVISGAEKIRIMYSMPHVKISEPDLSIPQDDFDGVLDYYGYSVSFKDLLEYRSMILEHYLSILPHGKIQKTDTRQIINVHIRLGDFQQPDLEKLKQGALCYQTPIEWFRETITKIQREVPDNVKFVIYSDGTDAQLKPVLSLRNVSRSTESIASVDLYNLSNTQLIISSGSTFAMWATFLGNCSRIAFPGQLHEQLCDRDGGIEYERDMGEDLSEGFREFLLRTFQMNENN